MSYWSEATDPEGRIYYYNTDGGTSWEKPRELFTELELKLDQHGWKAGKSSDGKVYYYNKESGESKWEVPVFPEEDKPAAIPASPESNYENKSLILQVNVKPKQEAEKLFMNMLQEHQIDSTWSFNKIISELSCTDPRYWCVDDDPLWKRQMFEKYLSNRSEDQLLLEHSAISKFKKAFVEMLRQNKDIHYYTRWVTARRLIANEPIYKHSVVSEKTKKQTFQEYIEGLRSKRLEGHTENKEQALLELREYLRGIMPTRERFISWPELSNKYLFENNSRFMSNKHFTVLMKEDVLKEYIIMVDKCSAESEQELKKYLELNYTKDRIARDGFKALLKELDGQIHSTTKWEDVYPRFKTDERFLAMLGRSGSSALDLFLDVVEDKTITINAQRSIAKQLLIDAKYQWSDDHDANAANISSLLENYEQFKCIDDVDRRIIVSQLVNDQKKKVAEQAELRRRLLEQRKGYFLLLLQRFYVPPRSKPERWEDAVEQLKNFQEFIELEDVAVKKQLFEGFQSSSVTPASSAPAVNPRKRALTPSNLTTDKCIQVDVEFVYTNVC